MKTAQYQSARLTLILSGLVICLCGAPPLSADAVESARLLPDDVMVMVSIESVNDLRTALEKQKKEELGLSQAMVTEEPEPDEEEDTTEDDNAEAA